MSNPLFWIVFISMVFWALYQKWDEKTDKFISYPYLTTLYFLFGSGVMLVFFPHTVKFFGVDKAGILLLIGIVLLTYFLYDFLNRIEKKEIRWPFKDYFQLLDKRYVIPKLAEIIFQQVFFVSIFVIALNSFGGNITLFITIGAFVLAHLNLFLFRSFREAVFYLLFSIVGAPLFILLIVNTEVLWYSISLHLLFYTFLSVVAWTWNVVKK
jgi:hypothetical protein